VKIVYKPAKLVILSQTPFAAAAVVLSQNYALRFFIAVFLLTELEVRTGYQPSRRALLNAASEFSFWAVYMKRLSLLLQILTCCLNLIPI